VVSESVAQGASLPRGVGACIHTLPESVVSLIPWRPRCSEEAAVPLSGQTAVKEALFQRGEVCCSRQQTGDLCADPFLRFRQCGSCRPQVISFCGRVGRIQLRGLAKGGGRWRRRTSRASVARGERASCAEQRTGEATYARGRKCENALELRGRASAEFPGQAMHGAL
jgi:hypothetical protein